MLMFLTRVGPAGKVYDVTDFLPGEILRCSAQGGLETDDNAEHPGGQAIILKYAGKDAT